MEFKLYQGDCLKTLKTLPENSVDSIITDPPYGLSFMGKKWDYDVPSTEIWKECLRVLKPGGHLLAFAGTRTQHRMTVRIEDAGFEIRDMMAWVYGSGFPKSHDVSKAIDKAAGAVRKVVGVAGKSGSERNSMAGNFAGGEYMETAPATNEAKQWNGWGTALKPALEPITLARKPFVGTVADNVMEHGTGAINIDDSRIDYNGEVPNLGGRAKHTRGDGYGFKAQGEQAEANKTGRFPANLIHDGSEEIQEVFGESSRFFYCAKASKKDRNEGLDGLTNPADQKNNHPTVKPTELMRYLCRLITPPNGTVLDPFMGSGSTGKAAMLEGFSFIGYELDKDYLEIAKKRIENAKNKRRV